MKMKEIMKKAIAVGVEKPDGMGKPELIHAIQLKEGNPLCYATAAVGHCDQKDCLWHADCMEDSTIVKLHVHV